MYTDRQHYLKGRSGDTVVPIFRSIMEQALQYVEPADFNTPSINDRLEEKRKKEERSLREQLNKFDEKMLKETEKWMKKIEKGKENLKEI